MRFTLRNPLEALGIEKDGSRSARSSHRTAARRGRIVLVLLFCVFIFLLRPSPPFPPSYKDEKLAENTLPQHNSRLAVPEGRNGRYIKFDAPFNPDISAQLQRNLLQHTVAVSSNRSYAFEPVRQDKSWLPFKLLRWPWRNARIPLSAFISTSLNGFERLSRRPRAVSSSYYASVCGGRERVHRVRSSQNPHGDLELASNGPQRLRQLATLLSGTGPDDACIRIVGDVFDRDFLESEHFTDIAEEVIESPVLQYFSFSPKVLGIINRLIPSIAPNSDYYDLQRAAQAQGKTAPPSLMWKHVLVIQLPHHSGWDEHCTALGKRLAPFASFNKLPLLPGNENVPPPRDTPEPTVDGLYAAKCRPGITAVMARVRRMRKNHPLLRTVYVVSDGPAEYTEEVSRWLIAESWEKVFIGNLDAYPDWDDRELGDAVDTEIARRAGVFVGNGVGPLNHYYADSQFTTLASNVALLRTRDGVHPDFTQYW